MSQSKSETNMKATGDMTLSKPTKKRKIPEYLTKLNAIEKALNNKIIKRMQTQINYLRNPRFKIDRPPLPFLDVTLLALISKSLIFPSIGH